MNLQLSLNLSHPKLPFPYGNYRNHYTCYAFERTYLLKLSTTKEKQIMKSGNVRDVSWHKAVGFSRSAKVKYYKCGSVALSLSTLAGPRKTMCINMLKYHAVIRKRIRRSNELILCTFRIS